MAQSDNNLANIDLVMAEITLKECTERVVKI